jgi:hypothetical protein
MNRGIMTMMFVMFLIVIGDELLFHPERTGTRPRCREWGASDRDREPRKSLLILSW